MNSILLLHIHYRGDWHAIGPYEVVQSGGKWRCVNGTLPDKYPNLSFNITGDYADDACEIASLIDYALCAVSAQTVYKYVN